MPRGERIEYEDAYYYVMNRSRGRHQIYHGRAYYEAFIEGMPIITEREGNGKLLDGWRCDYAMSNSGWYVTITDRGRVSCQSYQWN